VNLVDGPLPNVSFMLIRNLIMDATSEQDFNRGLYGNTCMSEYIFFSQELQSCLNVSRHMYQYLAKYNLLHAPSGFRSNHSCQTALVNIIDRWIEEMNNVNVNVVILLDLKRPLMLLTMISWLRSLK
jgi:hypothetical protein